VGTREAQALSNPCGEKDGGKGDSDERQQLKSSPNLGHAYSVHTH